MAQGPSANPDKFSPPAPWGAAAPETQQSAGQPPAPIVFAPFIDSVSTVNAPTLVGGLQQLPFIASVSVVYAPSFSGSGTLTFDTSGSWVCPPGVTIVQIEARGGGGGGGDTGSNNGNGGGGGGAYAKNVAVPVTPGTTYSFTVGAAGSPQVSPQLGPAGPPATAGGTSSFTGDSSTLVAAVGGGGANGTSNGAGGLASASSGTTKFSGGDGVAGVSAAAQNGGGGGEGANSNSNGANGSGQSGGSSGDGGNGGTGGTYFAGNGSAGSAPGGGGGGGSGFATSGGAGAGGRILITFVGAPAQTLSAPFISSVSTVYPPVVSINYAVLSQLTIEVEGSSTGPVRLSQLPVEVLRENASTATSYAGVSQLAVEVLGEVLYERFWVTLT